MLFSIAAPAQNLSITEKRVLADKLIEGEACAEELILTKQYSSTQDSIITTQSEQIVVLKEAVDYSVSKADSLFTNETNLRLELNKTKERSYRKTNAIVISVAVAIIEAFIITQK